MRLFQNDDQEPRTRLTSERKWGWWKLTLFLLGFGLFCIFFYRLASGQEAVENHDPKPVPGVVLLPSPDMEVDGVVVASRTDVQNKLQAIAISINGLKERSDSQLAVLRETVEQLKTNIEKQAVTIAALQKIKLNSSHLDVTTDTPFGEIKPGGDITAALQWALDNLHLHRKEIYLPTGDWLISKTIRTPKRSGLTLVGAGFGGNEESRFNGTAARLKWAGESGGVMLEIIGNYATIGNFTLLGTGKETGILVTKVSEGVGTGTINFLPIVGVKLDTVIQCGATPGEHNCDNLRFQWLIANQCGRAYKGVNVQGMNIVVEHLNLNGTPFGIDMFAGGFLWVQESVIVCDSCTLLKIHNASGKGVGKNNGYFRFSNTQLDGKLKGDFFLVDSDETYHIEVWADGGLQASPTDVQRHTFAKLRGAIHLTISGWDMLPIIHGVADKTYGRPTVTLRDCRVWSNLDNAFTGQLSVAVRDCITTPINGVTQRLNFEREVK